MALETVVQGHLRHAIGLDIASIGAAAVAARRPRASDDAARSIRSTLLAATSRRRQARLRELIEAIVVSETWFFRDPEAFATMVKIAATRRRTTQTLCCAFSVSRALPARSPTRSRWRCSMPGFAVDRFRIDAFDISARAFAQIARAIRKELVSGQGSSLPSRHFTTTPHGAPSFGSRPGRFASASANILDPDFLARERRLRLHLLPEHADLFRRAARAGAVAVLTRLLRTTACCSSVRPSPASCSIMAWFR